MNLTEKKLIPGHSKNLQSSLNVFTDAFVMSLQHNFQKYVLHFGQLAKSLGNTFQSFEVSESDVQDEWSSCETGCQDCSHLCAVGDVQGQVVVTQSSQAQLPRLLEFRTSPEPLRKVGLLLVDL